MNRTYMIVAWLISALAVIAGSVWIATGAGATEPARGPVAFGVGVPSPPAADTHSTVPYVIAAALVLVALGLLVVARVLRRRRRELDRLAADYARETGVIPAYQRGTSPVRHRW